MAVHETLRCPCCGYDRPLRLLGLAADGHFDVENAYPNELSLRRDHIGGRGRLRVERVDVPLHYALGLRQMLRYRLARVEEELRAAGVELDD